MFAQRLAGQPVARIARALNDAGVPCPSAADPGRNRHRTGVAWTVRTVATILSNPRYTGRQVWNRQRTDTEVADPAGIALGHKQVQRWNLPGGWVISNRPAHPALVSEANFIAAQDISVGRGPAPKAGPSAHISSGTCWPGCLPAGSAGGGWHQPGPTARPRTGAATATPAPPRPARAGAGTPTFARTTSCRSCPRCTCC
jgi:hypothetical protein